MALALSQFGSPDKSLYAAYLLTYYGSVRSIGLAASEGVPSGATGWCGTEGREGGEVWATAIAYLEGIVHGGCCGVSSRAELDYARAPGDTARCDGGVFRVDGGGYATSCKGDSEQEFTCCDSSSRTESAGSGKSSVVASGSSASASCERAGEWRNGSSEGKSSGLENSNGEREPVVSAGGTFGNAKSGDSPAQRGKHYARNKARRIKKRNESVSARETSASKSESTPVSANADESKRASVGTGVPEWRRNAGGNGAATVDSRTEVEIEAAQTLAARRVVENKVAILKGEKILKSFGNAQKTEALETLEAARVECRINTAMERSQKAYNNHDKSLKSVGSAASAGEFAFKKMVAKCAEQAELIASLTAQVDAALHASPGKVWEAVSAVPEARRISVRDIMGEPDSKWSMKKTNTFYNILNAEAVGNYRSDWKDLF